MPQFKFANSNDKVPGDGTPPSEFTIKAPASTDIWDKPPSTSRFSAPILYQSIPLSSFKRARVAFNALWEKQYDQGGLIIVLNTADGGKKWVKTGIELTHGRPHLSTVAKDNWADWSLLTVPSGGGAATLEMAKEQDNSLWIYLVEGLQKSPLREITWIFEEKNVTDCWVGVYAARPSSEGGELPVNFGHLIIDQA
jgi:regulation of enolase protein 1 (concanavalin A-like superfamily)